MSKKKILIAASAFAALVVLVGVWRHGEAAAAGVAGAFALIGAVVCSTTGVCGV